MNQKRTIDFFQRHKPMVYKGKDVRNVFHLRTPEDANSIARLANNKNAVIVGTSYVGEEKRRPSRLCSARRTFTATLK